jgi:putative alpha-1,2-mannosidase
VGNDDVGQMSAWLVFTALGFYPAQPFSGQHVTGSPLADSAVLHLGSGRRLRISGHGMQRDAERSTGHPTALPHASVAEGGESALRLSAADSPQLRAGTR